MGTMMGFVLARHWVYVRVQGSWKSLARVYNQFSRQKLIKFVWLFNSYFFQYFIQLIIFDFSSTATRKFWISFLVGRWSIPQKWMQSAVNRVVKMCHYMLRLRAEILTFIFLFMVFDFFKLTMFGMNRPSVPTSNLIFFFRNLSTEIHCEVMVFENGAIRWLAIDLRV